MGKSFKFNNDVYLDMCAILHPVGEIYITTDSNFNPNNNWVGTWELITDKFLIGAGNNYNVNSTGGNENIDLSHDHNLSDKGYARIGFSGGSLYSIRAWADYKNYNQKQDGSLGHTAGTYRQDPVSVLDGKTDSKDMSSVSILPPYIGVYMWHRIS